MNAFERIIFASCLKRAALVEEFLISHRLHFGPNENGAHLEVHVDDPFATKVNCPCGAKFTASVVVSVVPEIEK